MANKEIQHRSLKVSHKKNATLLTRGYLRHVPW
ncbi:hypothetical protein MNBD_GAMMA12-2876 [hydrothermal vent metagenome]|uniref:Uncharacterized protein n=1 Tax=hydrothermal vent metagenome TaxID=652676 RepID=A0A3B0Z4C7_9ZZZZ